LTAKKKPKQGNALRRIARVIESAGRDADLARRSASDPNFRRRVQADRREALSSFRAVKDALADRQKIEKSKRKKT
jgi:hypothetical protein